MSSLEKELEGEDARGGAFPSVAPVDVNLDAHEGLRGAAAIWIMVFHCFRAYRAADIDFQGSSLMPLFFLLTGFTLAIVYNKISPSADEIACSSTGKRLTFWSFVSNRFVRVAPVYYLMSAVAIPMWLKGFGDMDPSSSAIVRVYATTATFTSTLFCFCVGVPLDGPAWTVQTFVWIWLGFPRAMQGARRMTSDELSKWISQLYWVQLAVLISVFMALVVTPLGFWPAFAAATMNPISRFPLFLMGVYAGELRMRAARKQISLLSSWPRAIFSFFPGTCACCSPSSTLSAPPAQLSSMLLLQNADSDIENNHGDVEQALWTGKALWLGLGLLALTLSVSLANSLAGTNILGAIWLQALVPFCQLKFIVALTMSSPDSIMHRALTTRLAKFLGKLSMTIYLTHYLVIWYVEWGIYGFKSCPWPSGAQRQAENNNSAASADDEVQQQWNTARQLPLWGIPLVVAISLPIATLVYFGFEEPIRRLLRS